GLVPVLEQQSGKRAGAEIGVCYSPEFIALGSVIRDFLNPDFLLIGEIDAQSGAHLEARYRDIVRSGVPVRRMTLENAELAKIALNSFLTTKITFANMLAELCGRMPGGDVDVVADAIGLDSRIGRKYLTGGLGFGGPCFPRDNIALAFIGESLSADCSILRANDAFNNAISQRSVAKLQSILRKGQNIAVLGLSYKPKSHVIEESSGIFLCRA